MKKGFFITFEGGEGSGKTTLLENIRKYLESKNRNFIFTREPGGTVLGEEIRELVLRKRKEKIAAKAELCLFLASRAQHIQEIILPSLKEGKIVLSDRYNDSSIAYQGFARGLGMEEVIQFSFYIIEDAIPDLTIFLDIDPKIGLSRVKGNYDRIESEKILFHQKIREGFLILADKFPERIKIIDATLSQEEVFQNAMNYIQKLLK
ncbi:MAG: dTMP kinase [Parachlamydiales bacterium]